MTMVEFITQVMNVGALTVIAGIYLYDNFARNKKMERTLDAIAASNENISKTLAVISEDRESRKKFEEKVIRKIDCIKRKAGYID